MGSARSRPTLQFRILQAAAVASRRVLDITGQDDPNQPFELTPCPTGYGVAPVLEAKHPAAQAAMSLAAERPFDFRHVRWYLRTSLSKQFVSGLMRPFPAQPRRQMVKDSGALTVCDAVAADRNTVQIRSAGVG